MNCLAELSGHHVKLQIKGSECDPEDILEQHPVWTQEPEQQFWTWYELKVEASVSWERKPV